MLDRANTSEPRATRRLARNFAWMASGNVAFAVAQGAQLIVLARLGDAGTVGVFALGLAIATPAVVLSQLRLQDVIATDVRRDHRIVEYAGLTAITSALALLASWLVAVALGYDGRTVLVTELLAISKVLESYSLLSYGVQQRQERMAPVGLSLMARGMLGIAGLLLGFVIGGRDLAWGVLGLIAANALVLVAYDLPNSRRTLQGEPAARRGALQATRLARLATSVLPLGLMAVLVSATVSIPRIILERVEGTSELGVFAALAYLVVASTVVARALAQSAAPRLASAYVGGDFRRFRKLVARLALLAAGGGIIAIALAAAIGRPVLDLLYGEDYAAESGTLVLLTVYGATMFVALTLTQAMIAARRFAQQLLVFGATVVASVGFGLALIPTHGMTGAAVSIIIAGSVRVVGSWMVVVRAAQSPGS